MIAIELLPSTAATDDLVVELTTAVNCAYTGAEEGLWLAEVTRTSIRETTEAIARGEQVIARIEGRIAGSVRTHSLARDTAWFGALAVDRAQGRHGIGGGLVAFAEDLGRSRGAVTMQLEVLVPAGGHPHTDLLAGWYERLGYREVERRGLAEIDPSAAPLVAVPCEVALMRKHLTRPG